MSVTLSDDEAASLVEWLSEIGDPLSYQVAPDPNPVGIGIRLRVQSCKHLLGADPQPSPTPVPPPAIPTTMYDSTNPADIPDSAMVLQGYMDGIGSVAWLAAKPALVAAGKRVILLSVLAAVDADGYDIEAGNAPARAVANAIRQRSASLPVPLVYCNRSSMYDVSLALGSLPYVFYIADWTGQAHLVPGSVATQYANPAYGSGGHFDISLLGEMFPY